MSSAHIRACAGAATALLVATLLVGCMAPRPMFETRGERTTAAPEPSDEPTEEEQPAEEQPAEEVPAEGDDTEDADTEDGEVAEYAVASPDGWPEGVPAPSGPLIESDNSNGTISANFTRISPEAFAGYQQALLTAGFAVSEEDAESGMFGYTRNEQAVLTQYADPLLTVTFVPNVAG